MGSFSASQDVPCHLARMVRIALLGLILATPALAEDAAHRADRLYTQSLNRRAAAAIERRDRGVAPSQRSYAQARAKYERDMAAWRARVERCDAGDWSACR